MKYSTGKNKLRSAIRLLKMEINWDGWKEPFEIDTENSNAEIEAYEEAIRTLRAALRAMTADSRGQYNGER